MLLNGLFKLDLTDICESILLTQKNLVIQTTGARLSVKNSVTVLHYESTSCAHFGMFYISLESAAL